jgi:hypothetical protein
MPVYHHVQCQQLFRAARQSDSLDCIQTQVCVAIPLCWPGYVGCCAALACCLRVLLVAVCSLRDCCLVHVLP